MPLPAVAALIGSAITAGANMYNNQQAFSQQKALNKQKYEDMIKYASQYGATPTSIISGITGSAGGSVPSASSSNNPVPDFGSSLSSAVSADAALKQSEAAKEEASAASVRAETERQLGLMRLQFEPQKYFADIQKSLSEAFKNTKEAFLHGSMKQYYDELSTDIRKVRPWKIAGLAQGLLNDMATYNKIVQETSTSKAQEGYFKSASYAAQTQGDLNKAYTDLTYHQALNEGLRGFRLQWENTLLSYGIDPNKPFWENTGRLMYTNPSLFQKRMNMFISSLNSLDGKLQENLGEHYKRNIALGIGAYQFNKIHQQNANNRSMRFKNYTSAIGSLIPFAGGSSSFNPNPF